MSSMESLSEILAACGVEVRSTYVYDLYVVWLSRSRRVTQ